MKMKRTLLIGLLCLVLCLSLLPVSAFADDTLIIIGGVIQQSTPVVTQGTSNYQGSSVVTGRSSGSSAFTADGSQSNIIVSNRTLDSSASVIVMPNGSVAAGQSGQTVQTTGQTTQTTVQVPQNGTQTVAVAPAGLVNEIYRRINEVRVANGLGILGYDSGLQATADLRAEESSRVFGHTRPDGSAAVTAVTVDYNVAGENLIQVNKEYATADIMVETWLASETHKANIMLADFTQTAIGVYESNGTIFVSQIFTD